MLDYSREAIALAERRSRSDLDADRMLQLSLVRLVEIVGEAATRVSPEARERLPHIPWPQIAGMRNRLIHGYDFVDYDILWQTVAGAGTGLQWRGGSFKLAGGILEHEVIVSSRRTTTWRARRLGSGN